MPRAWDERRETRIAVTIASLDRVEPAVDSVMIRRRLDDSPPVPGALSEEERDRLRLVEDLNETDVLVLHSVEALSRDGMVTARALTSDEWPFISRYEDIALTADGRHWIHAVEPLTVSEEPSRSTASSSRRQAGRAGAT